jgi:hypothetical protein
MFTHLHFGGVSDKNRSQNTEDRGKTNIDAFVKSPIRGHSAQAGVLSNFLLSILKPFWPLITQMTYAGQFRFSVCSFLFKNRKYRLINDVQVQGQASVVNIEKVEQHHVFKRNCTPPGNLP